MSYLWLGISESEVRSIGEKGGMRSEVKVGSIPPLPPIDRNSHPKIGIGRKSSSLVFVFGIVAERFGLPTPVRTISNSNKFSCHPTMAIPSFCYMCMYMDLDLHDMCYMTSHALAYSVNGAGAVAPKHRHCLLVRTWFSFFTWQGHVIGALACICLTSAKSCAAVRNLNSWTFFGYM